MSRCYCLDSSAIGNILVHETETDALQSALSDTPRMISSILAIVEVERVIRRGQLEKSVGQRSKRLLASMTLVRISEDVLAAAGTVGPPDLGSLDAIHLASALSAQPDIDVFITYDKRLAGAAQVAGLEVWAPA